MALRAQAATCTGSSAQASPPRGLSPSHRSCRCAHTAAAALHRQEVRTLCDTPVLEQQRGTPGFAASSQHALLQVVRRWAALSIGGAHSAGVAGDGECYTWGLNDHGQLGVVAGPSKDVPTKMDILRGWDVRAIACG